MSETTGTGLPERLQIDLEEAARAQGRPVGELLIEAVDRYLLDRYLLDRYLVDRYLVDRYLVDRYLKDRYLKDKQTAEPEVLWPPEGAGTRPRRGDVQELIAQSRHERGRVSAPRNCRYKPIHFNFGGMPDKLLDLARAGGIRLSIAVAGSQDSPAPADG